MKVLDVARHHRQPSRPRQGWTRAHCAGAQPRCVLQLQAWLLRPQKRGRHANSRRRSLRVRMARPGACSAPRARWCSTQTFNAPVDLSRPVAHRVLPSLLHARRDPHASCARARGRAAMVGMPGPAPPEGASALARGTGSRRRGFGPGQLIPRARIFWQARPKLEIYSQGGAFWLRRRAAGVLAEAGRQGDCHHLPRQHAAYPRYHAHRSCPRSPVPCGRALRPLAVPRRRDGL